MASADFAPLADALAADHTVVTYDPRGIAGSSIDDPEQDSTPELRADDVAALLDALGAESADVFGSSGGAVTGLALVARHPGRVRTLVAHEPPLLELLPDAAAQRAKTEDIIATFHAEGMQAAWFKFMVNAGFDKAALEGAPDARRAAGAVRTGPARGRPLLRPRAAANDPVPARYRRACRPPRVVVGIGADSGRLLTYRTSVALCERLGSQPVEFPGDHGGFLGAPAEFADILRMVFSEVSSPRSGERSADQHGEARLDHVVDQRQAFVERDER